MPSLSRRNPRTRRRALRVAALALLGIVACGDDDPLAPLPERGPPDTFVVRADFYGYGSMVVTLKDDGALEVVRTPDFDQAQSSRFTVEPTDADWEEFWRAARVVGLPRWPRSCVNTQVVDGGGISVDISHEGGRIEASTTNAYPTSDGRCVWGGIDPSDEYTYFVQSVGELIGRPFP